MFNTLISRQLNVEYPICNAGMAFVAETELAAAVTNAGGIGMIGSGINPVAYLQKLYQNSCADTDGPIGIDFITPFFTEQHLDFVLAVQPPVVVFFWGFPEETIIEQIRANGTLVWLTVNSETEARQALDLQADALVVQGLEAGGHNKSILPIDALFPLVQQIAGATPMLIAGGIKNGRDLVRALALGASGVWCGTRFLASYEANAHPGFKQAVLDAADNSTVITTAFGPEWPDQPMRVYKNRAVAALLSGKEEQQPACIGSTEIAGQTVEMPRYSALLPTRATCGSIEDMALTMGVCAGKIQSIESVADIISNMVNEARQISLKY